MDIDSTRRNKKPRQLTDAERDQLDEFVDAIHYSSRYNDDHYEYRHVQLPKAMLKKIPKDYFDGSRGTLKLLWEDEWRGLGITQSLGWEHYEVHEPEPHILLFKYVLLLLLLSTLFLGIDTVLLIAGEVKWAHPALTYCYAGGPSSPERCDPNVRKIQLLRPDFAKSSTMTHFGMLFDAGRCER